MYQNRGNLSENMQAALHVCQDLSTDELLELCLRFSDIEVKNETCTQLITAIASTLEERCASRIQLN